MRKIGNISIRIFFFMNKSQLLMCTTDYRYQFKEFNRIRVVTNTIKSTASQIRYIFFFFLHLNLVFCFPFLVFVMKFTFN